MYNNGWTHNSPFPPNPPTESYPSPAPTPQVDELGFPIPPSAHRRRTIPLPPNSFSSIRPHSLLGYNPSCPGLEYDVRHPPTYAPAPNTRLEWAYESATSPPTREMTITCLVLPRSFVVRPTFKGYDFVTILDVLMATHRAFRGVADAPRVNDSHLLCPRQVELQLTNHGTAFLTDLYSRSPRLMERFKWAGLSEQRAPGDWLLHIE